MNKELPECTCVGKSDKEFNSCIKRCRAFPMRNGDGTTKEDDLEWNRQWNPERMEPTP